MKINILNILNKIVYLLLTFVVFFYPTSSEGTINSSDSSIYIYYSICLFIIVLLVLQNSIAFNRIRTSALVLAFLATSSLVGRWTLGGRFAIARFIFIFLCLLVFSINYKANTSHRFYLGIFKIITLIMCIWNWCLILKNPFISEITKNSYSQFISYTTSTFVDRGRPIFTFGIYSYCAFFYALMFIIWLYLMNNKNENKYLCGTIIINILIFQLLLRSSTGLLLGSVMIYFFIRSISNRKTGLLFSVLFIAAGALFIYYQDFDWHRLIVGNASNGFVARYVGGLFADNIKAISTTIIGIGYDIIDNMHITYTDSGYIVLATMGGVFLPIIVYSLVYRSMRVNLPQQYYSKTFILFMLFELALPASLYPKALMAVALFYITMVSIKTNVDQEDSSINESV